MKVSLLAGKISAPFRAFVLSRETKWYVVYHDYGDLTAEERLRLSACLSVKHGMPNQGEFGCLELAGGHYAVGIFLLRSDEYQRVWNYMLSKWLPDSGYLPDESFCFEYYPNQEMENVQLKHIVEMFIPMKSL